MKDKKRFRTVFSEYQLAMLQSAFEINPYPDYISKVDLSKHLKLSEHKIQVLYNFDSIVKKYIYKKIALIYISYWWNKKIFSLYGFIPWAGIAQNFFFNKMITLHGVKFQIFNKGWLFFLYFSNFFRPWGGSWPCWPNLGQSMPMTVKVWIIWNWKDESAFTLNLLLFSPPNNP